MKKSFMLFCAAALSVPVSAMAGVNINVNLGLPVPAPVVVAGPPAVLFPAPPLFLVPPRLGIYVGVDVPYDIVYVDNYYYVNYQNGWYRSTHYNGPWVGIRQERLPLAVRRQGVRYIRSYRDREYRNYRQRGEGYRGRYFTPDRGGRPVFVDNRGPERRQPGRPDMRYDRRQEQRDQKVDRQRERREMKNDNRQQQREMRERGRRW